MKISLYSELVIESSFELSNDELQTLIFLYQPIIESDALGLYITMSYEAKNQYRTIKVLHKEICDLLGLTILNYEKLRKRLEAVGLVESYYDENTYYCILHRPLQPHRFINETALGSLLKEKIGLDMFNNITAKFKCETIDVSNLKKDTKSLNDIYNVVYKENINLDVRKPKMSKIKHSFDFDSFLLTIKNQLRDEWNTESFKNKVIGLAESYMLDISSMKRVFLNSFKDKNYQEFDITLMNDAACNEYMKKNKGMLTLQTNKEVNIKVSDEEKYTIKNLILKYFNSVTADSIKLIVDVKEKTGISIDTVEEMLKEISKNTDGVFPNTKYIDKVASTYLQKGMRVKKQTKKKTAVQLYEEYKENVGDDISWRN